nr:hypothetical protein [Tanacetum cinerariifolium]
MLKQEFFEFRVFEEEGLHKGYDRECNVKKVNEKARYSAFKISEVKTEELKAMVSVDSMLNWNEHNAENKTKEAEQANIEKKEWEVKFVKSLA